MPVYGGRAEEAAGKRHPNVQISNMSLGDSCYKDKQRKECGVLSKPVGYFRGAVRLNSVNDI